jgi:hypothetical protein
LASADTINATNVDYSRAMSIYMNEKGTVVSGLAGVILIDLTTGGNTYHRDTLCVDLYIDILLGQTYHTVVTDPNGATALSGKPNLGLVSWMIDNALLPGQQTFLSALPAIDWVTTPQQGAGLQLAIWDLVEDNGDGLDKGNLQASTTPGELTDPGVLYWANTYEAIALGELAHPTDLAYVYVNDQNGTGAQMLEGPQYIDGGPEPFPEPSTFGLGGGGLLAAAFFSLRKKIR